VLDVLKSAGVIVIVPILHSECFFSATDQKVEIFVAFLYLSKTLCALRGLRQVVCTHRLQLHGDVTRQGSCSSY